MVMEILGATLIYPTEIFIVIGVGMAVTLGSSLIHRKTASKAKMDVNENWSKYHQEARRL